MKITLYMLKVLRVFLSNSNPKHGLELCKASGVNVGALYPILMRLEREGWLTSEWELIEPQSTRNRQRYYHLTALGKTQAEQAVAESREDVDRITIGQRFHFWVDGVVRNLDRLANNSAESK